MSKRTLHDYAVTGLWALPIYGLANFIGTFSSQPNYNKNFPAYARYVSTGGFRADHLAASILGTGIGLLGFTALFVYLASARTSGVSVAAFVSTIGSAIWIARSASKTHHVPESAAVTGDPEPPAPAQLDT